MSVPMDIHVLEQGGPFGWVASHKQLFSKRIHLHPLGHISHVWEVPKGAISMDGSLKHRLRKYLFSQNPVWTIWYWRLTKSHHIHLLQLVTRIDGRANSWGCRHNWSSELSVARHRAQCFSLGQHLSGLSDVRLSLVRIGTLHTNVQQSEHQIGTCHFEETDVLEMSPQIFKHF